MNDIIAEHVRRMKRGEEDAFDWIYETYVERLYRMAYMITGNQSDSEDIVQETFVKCYLRKESLQSEQAFEAWLYQILVRTAWRLQKQKKKGVSLEELMEDTRENGGDQWIQNDPKAVQPLETILKEEQNNRVIQAVQTLDMKQKTVVMLYYFNELSVEEIAKITGSFVGTVKSRLFKARKNLKKLLEENSARNETARNDTGKGVPKRKGISV